MPATLTVTTESLTDYIQSEFGVDPGTVSADSPLFTDGTLDSFSMVDLVMYLEKQCGFRMSPTEVSLDNLDSIQKILNFVATKM